MNAAVFWTASRASSRDTGCPVRCCQNSRVSSMKESEMANVLLLCVLTGICSKSVLRQDLTAQLQRALTEQPVQFLSGLHDDPRTSQASAIL